MLKTPRSFFHIHKIFWKPNLRILRKLGYSVKAYGTGDTETRLILLALCASGFAFLAGYLVHILDSLNISSSLDLMLAFMGLVISFDLIKELIDSEIKALKKVELSITKKALEKEYKTRDEKVIKYYLARIIKKPIKLDIKNLNLEYIPGEIVENQYTLLKDVQSFDDIHQAIGDIRYEVRQIEDKFWQALALLATKEVLGIDNTCQIIDEEPHLFLFTDLHIYLRAWLVCSIDNDQNAPMPVGIVGLHYPNERNPDFSLYINALRFISGNLLERKSFNKRFSSYALHVVKTRIVELQILMEDYHRENFT